MERRRNVYLKMKSLPEAQQLFLQRLPYGELLRSEPIATVDWELARPGDFVNLDRANRTGHSVIFMEWIRQAGEIAGIRYYGCNSRGDSHLDPDHPVLLPPRIGARHRLDGGDGQEGVEPAPGLIHRLANEIRRKVPFEFFLVLKGIVPLRKRHCA